MVSDAQICMLPLTLGWENSSKFEWYGRPIYVCLSKKKKQGKKSNSTNWNNWPVHNPLFLDIERKQEARVKWDSRERETEREREKIWKKKKDILTSFKRPKWPITKDQTRDCIWSVVFENNKSK